MIELFSSKITELYKPYTLWKNGIKFCIVGFLEGV